MCGICGILNFDADRPVDEAQLRAMRDCMTYRGPDDAGTYVDRNVGLGSVRLAILDLSAAGHMPMQSSNGRYWIAYNGEVYNFRELRPELEAKGVRFRSECDTEVLVELYAEYGPAMLRRCNGMFAIAIWDTKERSLFIARDRMGVKPLYYTVRDGRFVFGSEEKNLFAAGVPAEFDEDTWPELLCFRYVGGERTPYRGVERLLPGHYMLVQDGRVDIRPWWDLEDAARRAPTAHTRAQAAEELLDLLNQSTRLRRISDVPVGVLLSGGLDSGGVAAITAEQAGRGVESFTMRFTQKKYDEGDLAREVASRWGLQRHELYVGAEDLPALLQEATHLLDEPVVHGNDVHILAISRFAKPLVTVLLSGEGADEVLGGYVRYRLFLFQALFGPLGLAASALSPVLSTEGRARKTLELLAVRDPEKRLVLSSAEVFPRAMGLSDDIDAWVPYRCGLARRARRLYGSGPRQAMFYEQHTYLQSVLDRNDRMTMGASIECRVPYLDYRLVEWAASLPQLWLFDRKGIGKAPLRRALESHLPQGVLRGRKWGFAAPWHAYYRELAPLRAWVEGLPDQPVFESLPGGKAQVRSGVRRFLDGDDKLTAAVRQWVMVSLWHAMKIGHKPEPLAPRTPTQRS